MQNAYHQVLVELIEEHSLICGLVASSDGAEYARAGNFDSLESKGLADTLVCDSAAITRLNFNTEGEILPQIWAQGRVTAYVAKPRKNLIVVMFAQDDKDAVAHYHLSKIVNSSLIDKVARKIAK